jgi:hypothetical protein
MNLLANHFLAVCSLTEQPNDYTSNTENNKVSEPHEQTTMVPWDVSHTSSFDIYIEEEEFSEILVVQTRSEAPIDPGGYRWPPTFSNLLKTIFSQFWQFTIFSSFNFWGHFDGLNEGFSGSSLLMITERMIEPQK